MSFIHSTATMVIVGLAWCLAVLCGLSAATDVNWGKKVSCFVVEGTVVCPGCNYRAGLSCPRSLKNSQNCLASSPLPRKKAPTKGPETTQEFDSEDINSTTTEMPLLPINFTTPETNEIMKESTKEPIDMAIYLYRLLGPKMMSYYQQRSKRDTQLQQQEEEEPEVCNWNGDCPCPLICCKTGPGCPKRCVMGIRLPPPYG